MLELTTGTAEVIRNLVEQADLPDGGGVRVQLGKAAENGAAPGFVLALVDQPEDGDEEIVEQDAHVYVDSDGARILDDAALDAQVMGSEVTFSLMPKPNG
jgi:Fe-S cluster assembly iron-binding protein IscA